MKLKTYIENHLLKIVLETLYVVGIAAIIALILGLIIASILYLTKRSKKSSARRAYQVINIIINTFRSFPFFILLYFLIPFTRIVMKMTIGIGTSTGPTAAIVPLVVGATPFFAKVIENALIEVKEDVIQAANSLGLSTWQIIIKVLLPEALPSIVLGITLAVITLIGFSAIVGNVGGGGIGSFAYNMGQQSSDSNAMLYAVITIIILVQLISLIGNKIYKKVK